jgi:hypothetical protein
MTPIVFESVEMTFKDNYRLGTPYRIDERNDIRICPYIALGRAGHGLVQEEFEKYSEAERPSDSIHPLQQIEVTLNFVEASLIGSHRLGRLSRLVFRSARREERVIHL